MKTVVTICRIVFGIFFLISGFVKGIDPIGFEYKLIEYFNAWGLQSLHSLAIGLSFFLSALEFLIGMALLLTIQIRFVSFCALVFMIIMTPLTLIIAINNPVADCGCFGDAFIITNWETFFKNIVLLLASILIFQYQNRFKSSFNIIEQIVLFLMIVGGFFSLQLYCFNHLPIIDFRPYHIGANLNNSTDQNTIKERIILKYKNRITQEISTFTEENYPWQDTLHWEFIDSSPEIVQPSTEENKINFYVEHPQYGIISNSIAKNSEYTFLCISDNLTQIDTTHLSNLKKFIDNITVKGHQFYLLTASPEEDITAFQERYKIATDFAFMDETELKTIIRSNPGLVLIKDGVILNKWSDQDIPDTMTLNKSSLLEENITLHYKNAIKYQIISVVLFLILLLVAYLCRKHMNRIKKRF